MPPVPRMSIITVNYCTGNIRFGIFEIYYQLRSLFHRVVQNCSRKAKLDDYCGHLRLYCSNFFLLWRLTMFHGFLKLILERTNESIYFYLKINFTADLSNTKRERCERIFENTWARELAWNVNNSSHIGDDMENYGPFEKVIDYFKPR